MSMSKKDFIALADELRPLFDALPSVSCGESAGGLDAEAVRRALCAFMRGQNSQFKEGRWRSYLAGECGPGGGAVKKEAPKVVRDVECPHCGGDGKEPGAPDDVEAGAPQCGVCGGGQYVTHKVARKYRQEGR